LSRAKAAFEELVAASEAARDLGQRPINARRAIQRASLWCSCRKRKNGGGRDGRQHPIVEDEEPLITSCYNLEAEGYEVDAVARADWPIAPASRCAD
jgi:hypothetical protein